ncbi:hypothetical protein Tsp_11367 [Trichinella spiralis]|uniref:hypothetical protein n=1 Tax=Trichinella spiralis TaxID=6334 RepID=UPI0001EFE565|nr:hypothetical protein Tsp_11367 [Trichinella spiralis]
MCKQLKSKFERLQCVIHQVVDDDAVLRFIGCIINAKILARAALASTAGDEGKLCFLAALKAVYRRLYVRVVVDQGFAAACFCRALFGLCNSLWRRPPVNKQNSCRWIIDIFQSPGDTNNMQKMSFFQRKSSLPFPVVCDSLLIYPYRLVQVPEH